MKKAMDGRLRRLHRRDWHGFLNRMVPAAVWRSFQKDAKPKKDGRTRWTPKYVVLSWIVMGWSVQGELTGRFREGVEWLGETFSRRRRTGKTYQGFVKASQHLRRDCLQRFWSSARRTIPKQLGEAWYWYGWVVMGTDGSRFQTSRTRANERQLGKSGRDKSHPQWWGTCVLHLRTGLIWDWRIGPGDSSERSHVLEMLGGLPDRTLLVGDIGFGGFDFLQRLSEAGVKFLIRTASNTTLLLVEGTRQRIERAGEHRYIYLWPRDRRTQAPLRLRLMVLKRRGRRVYLVTNVMESERLSRGMASRFDQARWGLEVAYRSLKQTMERRKILAGSPEVGSMELEGNILAFALLMLHAVLAMGARMGRASVAKLLALIRRAIEAVRWKASTVWLMAALRTAVRDAYERHSSKKARDWPYKKREPVPSPPKLRRMSRKEKVRMQAFRHCADMVLS